MKPGDGGGGKGPQLEVNAIEATKEGRLVMSLTTPESIQKLRRRYPRKRRNRLTFVSTLVYDKVYRKDILGFAYACPKPMAAPLESITRSSRTSRSTGKNQVCMRAVRPEPYPAVLLPGFDSGICEVSRFSGMKFLGVSGSVAGIASIDGLSSRESPVNRPIAARLPAGGGTGLRRPSTLPYRMK